jgi:acyl-coenzyme A thioesterase PaaI-like protein
MSSRYDVRDPDYEQRVQASFAQQGLLTTLAAELGLVEPGAVEIEVPFSPQLTQQTR